MWVELAVCLPWTAHPQRSPADTGLLNALLPIIVSGPSPPKRGHPEVRIHFLRICLEGAWSQATSWGWWAAVGWGEEALWSF